MVSNRDNFYMKEYEVILNALNELKHCQILFLSFSATATAGLFGLSTFLANNIRFSNYFPSLLFLFPLIILFPAWTIFLIKQRPSAVLLVT